MGRERRSTARKVDYAKEQEFSDADDIFDEGGPPEDMTPARGPRSASKPRKSTGVRSETTDYGYNRPVYTEKGYDLSLPPIRERFSFLPEYEEDGSPRIELIVGRRPIDEKEDSPTGDDDEKGNDEDSDEEPGKGRSSRSKSKRSSPGNKRNSSDGLVEYEYLVKYRGRSYLHLKWMTGADLESMNKSAKGIYRRYVKKLSQGIDDELENPEFDPSYIVAEKIIDEADQEVTVELTDKELLRWEKEREKELDVDSNDEDDDPEDKRDKVDSTDKPVPMDETNDTDTPTTPETWGDEALDFSSLDLEKLRRIVKQEGSYYSVVKGSDNPYRDGYATEPPKKPRASYLFFQCTMRSYFQKQNPDAAQSVLMTVLGDHWRTMTEEQRDPFVQLAKEESLQYEKEKVLLAKAQKPNEVWQPLRRCKRVLERLANDSFADIFLEPVDLEEFNDYEEVVDIPMDLGTVKQKLETRKYQAPEQFARDMRRIWNNCKIYNQHGTAIWHVADYMSKQFERLYHAWVLEFRDRYLRWTDPRARPWEHTCRMHDGACKTADANMVLCDHCDAMYGIMCLDPPLKSVPSKAWHCRECKPKLRSAKGVRMLSAVAEHAARKRAELGDPPKKKVTQTMYLVKWAGLGYEFCTWEKKSDISDDNLITEFHKLNNSYAEETDIPAELVEKVLDGVKHTTLENAGGKDNAPQLRAQLYAQTRLLQFSKFGVDELPPLLKHGCGPKTQSCCEPCPSPRNPQPPIAPVIKDHYESHPKCPPLMTGEYDVVLPITDKGLLMNVGEVNANVSFLGYRQYSDGSPGPAEKAGLIRSVGDKIIAVDGVSTVGKAFQDVIGMLRESGKNKVAYMRFLENRFSSCESRSTSVGKVGRYVTDSLRDKFVDDRRRAVVQRYEETVDDVEEPEKEAEKDDSSAEPEDSEPDSEDEGEFQPESDDEDARDKSSIAVAVGNNSGVAPQEQKSNIEEGLKKVAALEGPVLKEETTRSLALRLMQVDVGYSSDEGGEENAAYYIDGVDATFCREEAKKTRNTDATLPARQNEFATLGDRAKLVAAIALSRSVPSAEKFDSVEAKNTKSSAEIENSDLQAKVTKRSTVKVEQVNATTGEVIHVWANVESAAATLQLNLPALRQVVREDYDEEIGDEIGGYKWRYALAGAKVTAGATSTSRSGGGKKAKEAWLEFRDKLYDPAEPHAYKNNNRLRDYQVDGVNWLSSTWYKRQGCVLADEMGLGKTVQIVCYIEHLFRVEKIRRPFLVVVPLSTVEHWRREFAGWTDLVCCVYHDRQRVWRDVLREYEWYFEDKPHTADYLKFDVLVTTYDTLIGDFDVVSQIPFRVAVVDEAHRLRNQKGRLLECMREISAKGTMHYGFQSRVLMSGTPLQNDLTELWTLLNFIEPFKFPDPDDFHAKFGNMANKEQVENLQQMISPFMLRRVKEDVAKDIPAKEETVIDVELTSIQKQYYRAIFEHNHAFLNLGATRQAAPKLMNIQMELRKVCNHPFLLEGVEHREMDRSFREFTAEGKFEGKSSEDQQGMLNHQGFVMSSGKMVLMDKLLPKLRQEGHKILVFSQMVKMLDLISDYCEFRGFRYERLDGRVRGTDRQKAIDRFEREEESFLFLLSTRAGGVGINLTAADICIIFDSDWNPQNDIQAQARCHRIGQTKDVRIYRLITSRSFEQEMFDRASKKLGLEQAVLGTFEKEKDDNPTQQEMEQLLKRGAYALLEDENDTITKEFCADDIESILAKRTRTRVVEGAKTASWLNKQGMVVSKSKFSSEAGGSALDMDDPQFWQKVMPDFVTPGIMLQKLDDLQHDIEGTTRGPGRGRRRKKGAKNNQEPEQKSEGMDDNGGEADETTDADQPKDVSADPVDPKQVDDETTRNGDDDQMQVDADVEGEDGEDEEEDVEEEQEKKTLSRAAARKVQKFMGELKSMMESVLEEQEEISNDDKSTLQKLLLTISVKESMFNEDQRHLARALLKRVEGDRRRRCRTSELPSSKSGKAEVENGSEIVDALRIVGKKRKKRGKRAVLEDETPRRKRLAGEDLDDDGYKRHSDSEADWSDVGGDDYLYGASSQQKTRMSKKEAKRRRQWCAGDDAATAAGRAWPVFPRTVVQQVLTTVLNEMIKYDETQGGIFSEPVSKEDFPEYYEQIKHPMDYSTMKTKLANGEYRSAQAMQKDFILILQNCREFNAKNSDIVVEAREQHLMRPKILREAALEHNLFLAEDGSVIEIYDEESPKKKKKKDKGREDGEGGKKSPKRKRSTKKSSISDAPDAKKPKGKGVKRKRLSPENDAEDVDMESESNRSNSKKLKSEEPVSGAANGSGSVSLFDVPALKRDRESLSSGFDVSRANLTSRGRWTLPNEAAGLFKEIALTVLAKMDRSDRYGVFADAVSEEEAPGYGEVVEKPMDFGTMKRKAQSGAYGEGSAAAGALYDDFILVFDNCHLYNPEDSEVAEEAARVLALLPEAFAAAVASALAKAAASPGT